MTTSDDPNANLYCLECGYNLRGLSGDPRRCPECGYENAIIQLTLPAGAIRRQMIRMESAAAQCVGAALLLGIMLTLPMLVELEARAGLVILPAIAVGVWGHGMVSFRKLCFDQPGWSRALALYHFYVTLVAVLVPTVLLGGGALASRVPDGCAAISLVLGATGVCIWIGAHWVRRKLRGALAPLQRRTAVRMIGEGDRR